MFLLAFLRGLYGHNNCYCNNYYFMHIVAHISFERGSQTVKESVGILKIRLVTDKIFQREQFIRISTKNGTAHSEIHLHILMNVYL